MSEAEQQGVYDASPIFDSLDVDLVLKVLSHTAFSESTFSIVHVISTLKACLQVPFLHSLFLSSTFFRALRIQALL